jgi:hypothetical protein
LANGPTANRRTSCRPCWLWRLCVPCCRRISVPSPWSDSAGHRGLVFDAAAHRLGGCRSERFSRDCSTLTMASWAGDRPGRPSHGYLVTPQSVQPVRHLHRGRPRGITGPCHLRGQGRDLLTGTGTHRHQLISCRRTTLGADPLRCRPTSLARCAEETACSWTLEPRLDLHPTTLETKSSLHDDHAVPLANPKIPDRVAHCKYDGSWRSGGAVGVAPCRRDAYCCSVRTPAALT